MSESITPRERCPNAPLSLRRVRQWRVAPKGGLSFRYLPRRVSTRRDFSSNYFVIDLCAKSASFVIMAVINKNTLHFGGGYVII